MEVADIRLFAELDAPLWALAEGRLDAVFGDGLGFWNWLRSPEGAGFAYVGDGYRLDEGIGIALRKEDEALRHRLNRALEAIPADGTYEKINAKYFPFSIYRSKSRMAGRVGFAQGTSILSPGRQTVPERRGHVSEERKVKLGSVLDGGAEGIEGGGPD